MRDMSASNPKQPRAKEAEEDRQLIPRRRPAIDRHFRAWSSAISAARSPSRSRSCGTRTTPGSWSRTRSCGSTRTSAPSKGPSSFFTWLYRIITNLSIDLIRKPGRQVAELDDSRTDMEDVDFPFLSRIDGADPADVVRRKEIAARLKTALEALPPYHRGVIVMREIEGLSYEEMAKAMDVSKGTIMSRLFHARQKLQRALHDTYVEQLGREPHAKDDGGEGGEP